MKNKLFIVLIALLHHLSSCKVENIGKDLSAGINKNMESIGKNLMTGISKGITDSFKQNLYHFVDSLVGTAGLSANRSMKNIIDSLTNEKLLLFTRSLIEEATGQQLKANVTELRNELLGQATNERMKLLLSNAVGSVLNEETNLRIAKMRDELLGDATNLQLTRLRDSLLGERTAIGVKAILDSALKGASTFLKTDLKEGIDSNASIIQKYAVRWLLLLGAIAAVIIFLVWRNRQKYLKMATVLAAQINSIPDQKTYDDLTSRIKEKAIETGIEPTLRKVLQENGLIGKENWEAKQLKTGAVLQTTN